jgi:hypothetical protein
VDDVVVAVASGNLMHHSSKKEVPRNAYFFDRYGQYPDLRNALI